MYLDKGDNQKLHENCDYFFLFYCVFANEFHTVDVWRIKFTQLQTLQK